MLEWNCSIAEWTNFCEGEVKFATTITEGNRPAWYASVMILAAIITADLYSHLVVMRQATPLGKIMLVAQCTMIVNIGILNASMCAGQDNPLDILLNTTGLIILNEMDNFCVQIFLVLRSKRSEEHDHYAENINHSDKVFARWLSFPQLGLVFYYVLWISGQFEYKHSE